MIRASRLSTKFANPGKIENLEEFLSEYKEALQFYIDYLFDNLPEDFFVPRFIITSKESGNIPPNSNLSARAIKMAATQAIGIVKSAVEKQRRVLWVRDNVNEDVKNKKFSKPVIKNAGAELSTMCCEYVDFPTEEFDGYYILKSIGKKFGKIIIPIKMHRHANKMAQDGKMMTSFLVRENFIDFRWKLDKVPKKKKGSVIGIDQGIKKAFVTSNGIMAQKCPHGHDLNSIMKKMVRKKKGSKAFNRAQDHRDNYIRWSLNNLDVSDVKEIRLEKIKNLRKGKRTSRLMSHFTYTTIRDKIEDICERNGVRFLEQDNKYRSQRCFECGFVHKRNRKLEEFKCLACGHHDDADLNASKNISLDLFKIPYGFLGKKYNVKNGFYHLKDCIDVCSEFAVPSAQKVT